MPTTDEFNARLEQVHSGLHTNRLSYEDLREKLERVKPWVEERVRDLQGEIARTQEQIASLRGDVTEAVERVDADISRLTQSQETAETRLTERIERLEERLRSEIGRVRVESSQFTVQLASRDASRDRDIRKLLKDRREFRTLWQRQKQLHEFRARLKSGAEHHLGVRNLVRQKGLEVLIREEEIFQLVQSADGYRDILRRIEAATSVEGLSRDLEEKAKLERLLASLSYAYILMAQHYKVASEHVLAVSEEKTKGDMFKAVAWGIFKIALNASVSVLVGAATGMVAMPLISGGFASVLKTFGEFWSGPPTSEDDLGSRVGSLERLSGAGIASREAALGTFVSSVVGQAAGLIGVSGSDPSTLMDPYEFFLARESELRRATAFILGLQDPAEFQQIRVRLERERTFAELREDPFWSWFQEQHSYDELDRKWEEVSRLLSTSMRRMCWQLYCRSQWQNLTNSHTVGFKRESFADWPLISFPEREPWTWTGEDWERDASEWPYTVWDHRHFVTPRHWAKICSDFRGPEHDPGDPLTTSRGEDEVEKATKRLPRAAWISMAVKYCCQIRRPIGDSSWNIDLMRHRQYAGISTGDTVDFYWQNDGARGGSVDDVSLVLDGRATRKVRWNMNNGPASSDESGQLMDGLMLIRSKGGSLVRIEEIRFGKGSRTGATGKKGRLSESNNFATALPVGGGCRVSVTVRSTNRLDTVTADIRIYVQDGGFHPGDVCGQVQCPRCKHIFRTDRPEIDQIRCTNRECGRRTALPNRNPKRFRVGDRYTCFYACQDLSEEERGRLATSPMMIPYKRGDKSFVAFRERNYSFTIDDQSGLYCVRLQSRKDLLGRSSSRWLRIGSGARYHQWDEWWFRAHVLSSGRSAFRSGDGAG